MGLFPMFDDSGQNQEKLAKASGGFWDDFWGSINRPLNFSAPTKGQVDAVRGPTDARNQMSDLYARGQAGGAERANAQLNQSPMSPRGSQSLQTLRSVKAVDTNRLPGLASQGTGTRQGNDDIPESRYRDGPSEDELRMEEIKNLLKRDFASNGEYASMVDDAYASALGNIGKARGQANSNFQESDGRIADLTASHVNEIQTRDRAAVEKNGSDLQSAYKETYGNARTQLQDQQKSEIAAKTEMLQRLGQQEAGVGEAGQDESEALTRLTENEAGAMQQAQGYKGADLARNTELAASQAGAGVERRSALNRDLQKILGNLDDSEATVNNSKAMAKLQGLQSEKNDFAKEQQFNLDSLTQMEDRIQGKADKTWERSFKERELAAKSAGKGASSGPQDGVSNDLSSRGIDPAPYMEAFNEVMSTSKYNPQVHGDKDAFYASQMKEVLKKKGLNADSSAVGRVVMGMNHWGTDKIGQ